MKAFRRLNDWLDSLPAWRLASTVGVPLFAVLLIAGGAIDWAEKGRINLAFLLPWTAVYTLVITAPYTFGQRRRQRLKRRAARSEAAGRSGRGPGHVQGTSLHDLFRTAEKSRD